MKMGISRWISFAPSVFGRRLWPVFFCCSYRHKKKTHEKKDWFFFLSATDGRGHKLSYFFCWRDELNKKMGANSVNTLFSNKIFHEYGTALSSLHILAVLILIEISRKCLFAFIFPLHICHHHIFGNINLYCVTQRPK